MNVPFETNFDAANFDDSPLAELVERLCHGDLAVADAQRLEQLVIADASARRYYARYLNLHANLPWLVGATDDIGNPLPAATASRSPLLGFLANAVRVVPGGEFVVGACWCWRWAPHSGVWRRSWYGSAKEGPTKHPRSLRSSLSGLENCPRRGRPRHSPA